MKPNPNRLVTGAASAPAASGDSGGLVFLLLVNALLLELAAGPY
jgi:hypothetical protein